MLSLEAQTGMNGVGPVAARLGAIQKVTGIKLKTGLGSVNLHKTTTLGILELGSITQTFPFGQNIVVIVTSGNISDSGSNGIGTVKIEGSSGHFYQFSGRNKCRIHRGIIRRGNGQFVIQNTSFPGQIIEGVVGQVYWRSLVGGGFISNLQSIPFKGVGYGHLKVARITFLSVCA